MHCIFKSMNVQTNCIHLYILLRIILYTVYITSASLYFKCYIHTHVSVKFYIAVYENLILHSLLLTKICIIVYIQFFIIVYNKFKYTGSLYEILHIVEF